jgi:hypothetical protein
VSSRTPYQLLDLGTRAAPAATVVSLRPGDSARVILVRGSGLNAEKTTIWLEVIDVDESTITGVPEPYAKALTLGMVTYQDRFTFTAANVAEVRIATSIRAIDRKSFAQPKARVH